MGSKHSPVVMLLGPTASGKSAAAMALASHVPIEIISMDSAQVYREMDVGTAKPSAADRRAVPHHLIDILDPVNPYSAARFAEDATRLIAQIRTRGNTPVLVGGTMLYAKALAEGLNNLPAADPAVRAQLDEQANQLGWPAMHKILADVDPRTAARLEPTDSQRIQRALEVHTLTGKAMSVLLDAAPERDTGQTFVRVALEPSDRAVLHQRIEIRFKAMIEDGLIDEVTRLRQRADLHPGLPAMRCVGYRQLWQWLENGALAQDRDQAIESGIAATRQLAKRQLTWLRSMPERKIVDCIGQDTVETAVDVILNLADTSS